MLEIATSELKDRSTISERLLQTLQKDFKAEEQSNEQLFKKQEMQLKHQLAAHENHVIST